MVLLKEVTAEYCHINPVRNDIYLGATEMPEQKNPQQKPTTKLSNKMHMPVLLFSALAEVKNTRK